MDREDTNHGTMSKNRILAPILSACLRIIVGDVFENSKLFGINKLILQRKIFIITYNVSKILKIIKQRCKRGFIFIH
jgi:hypothetical protein